jgi:DNA polymerase
MGVDFVPLYRSKKAAAPVVMVTAAAPAFAPVEVEPKPAAPAPPRQAPAAAAAATIENGGVVPPLAAADYRDDPRRAEATAALRKVLDRYNADAPHQHFVTDHHTIVFGEGDPCARLMFIGEAPGADEDRTGRPFVGRAGQLLTKMINAMGLRREDVYITNVLKTRPPNNATPTLEEAKLCSPYLFEQIGIIRPEAIVTLGLPATRLILGTDQSMSALRGRWSEFAWDDLRVPVMPTYHPAFLLRSYTKENREKVWSDLQKAMERVGLAAGNAAAAE